MKKSLLKKSQKPLKKVALRKQSISSTLTAKQKKEEREQLRIKDHKFYLDIWKDRGHKSDLTGNYLGNYSDEDLPSILFHHLLPKENYPEFRHCKWNICLCENKYHSQIETNPYLLPQEIFDRFIQILGNANKKAGLK